MEQANNSAKFAFFYLLSLVALVFVAISVGMVYFQIINLKVVDDINLYSGQFTSDSLKFAISALIIASPIYFLMVRFINRSLESGALSREAGIRRWLTYFILFVSAVVIIVWLIMTLNAFLNGEITLKFILKALTVLFIAGVIFGYYLYDIRRLSGSSGQDIYMKIFGYGSLLIVAVSLGVSFVYVESPAATRNRKQDEAIVNKFDQIDTAVNAYYDENKKMPASLEELKKDRKYLYDEESTIDSVSKKSFEYKVSAKDAYELCAEFKMSNKDKNTQNDYINGRWPHDAGRQCIKQVVHINDAVPVKR